MKTMTQEKTDVKASRKLFYRINEVANMTGLKPYVLRYWESEFKELNPDKDASDQRRYRPTDIDVVLAIKKLLYEDRFTIEGARKRLRIELKQIRALSPAESTTETPLAMQHTTHRKPASGTQLDAKISRLRKEVSDLIAMLSA